MFLFLPLPQPLRPAPPRNREIDFVFCVFESATFDANLETSSELFLLVTQGRHLELVPAHRAWPSLQSWGPSAGALLLGCGSYLPLGSARALLQPCSFSWGRQARAQPSGM